MAFVSVVGELDPATAPRLARKLRERQAQARMVVLDLRELEFMDSRGVEVIVAADTSAKRRGRRLVILRGPPEVDLMFTLTGAASTLAIHDLEPPEPPVQVLLQLAASERAVA